MLVFHVLNTINAISRFIRKIVSTVSTLDIASRGVQIVQCTMYGKDNESHYITGQLVSRGGSSSVQNNFELADNDSVIKVGKILLMYEYIYIYLPS